MPKVDGGERAEKWRALLTAGPEALAALEWLLQDDLRESVETAHAGCTAEQGRFWHGVGNHALRFGQELNEAQRVRRQALDDERVEQEMGQG